MNNEKTREPQYQICIDIRDRQGLSQFGLMSNQVWHDDPKRLVFMLSRYKFVAKMLSGRRHVLEVGCADAFGTRLVLQEVGQVTAVDFDPVFIKDAMARMDDRWEFTCLVHDILDGPVPGAFDGVYALDVLEHIPREREEAFVSNITSSMTDHATLIIGMPSLQSQAYASAPSREGHVNCKDHAQLKELLLRYFHDVYIFSMNDEIVHTGFYEMAHYLLALCCSVKRPAGVNNKK
jgi:SAM-dependent methyltransferase